MLSRDELRIVTIIPWADAWIKETVHRAWFWSDEILVGMDSWVDIDAHDLGLAANGAPESARVMNLLWLSAANKYNLTKDDYVCFLNSGEIFTDWAAIRPALRRHHGKRVGAMAYQMWNFEEYRTDWFAPQLVFPFVPYRPDTTFDHPLQYIHRGPSMVHNIHTVGHPVADLVSYRYASDETRKAWFMRYQMSDWPHHREWSDPIMKPARTEPYRKGGLI